MREPPYPNDTRAKGWRFELDYEKIEQSDTWSLSADVPLSRPCLLMMWLSAWTQEPCGSLPNDEAVIRARCQIPAATWAKVRHVLMRGWWEASDGRLYHDTLTKRVEEMIEYRRKNAKRVADFKAAKREQQSGNALPPDESHENNDTGTGTGTTSTPPVQKEERKRSVVTKPDDVEQQTWDDWVQLRKDNKAKVSVTALREARSEAGKADMSLERFLAVWCIRGSRGLQAAWIKPDERSMTFKERDAANAAERVRQAGGGLVHAKPLQLQTKRTDALQEIFDAVDTAARLG